MSPSDAPILSLDTGSPTVSLALGDAAGTRVVRRLQLRQSSERLLAAVGEVLEEAELTLSDLRGVAVLRGPGSFTGLRVGLGTVLGLHQALQLPAVGLPTLTALAAAGAEAHGLKDGDSVIAAVDAIRGEWMVQTFVLEGGEPQAVDLPLLKTAEQLGEADRPLVGFGVDELSGSGPRYSPEALAPHVLPLADRLKTWDPGTLVEPIYFRPPATTPAKRVPRPETAGPPSS